MFLTLKLYENGPNILKSYSGMNEASLLDSLDDLGFDKPAVEDSQLLIEFQKGPSSESFRSLLIWLSQELKFINDLQECIHEESLFHEDSFRMELTPFLREVG